MHGDWADGRRWAIEVKRSVAPKLERGFHAACEDVRPTRKFVVHPGRDRFPLAEDIVALPLRELLEELGGGKPAGGRRPR